MNTGEKTEIVRGLRELADLLEANPHLKISHLGGFYVYLPRIKREESITALKEWAKAMHTFTREADSFNLALKKSFGPLRMTINVDRDVVCRKVTKLVEQEVWECPESLLDESESSVIEPSATA